MSIIILFYYKFFTLKIHRWILNNGYLFVKFEQEVLIKYNSKKVIQRDLVYSIVIWFPNYWVRKTNCCEGKQTNHSFV